MLSGASTTEGVVRLNETGNSDDGSAIDTFLISKNVSQGKRRNIFLRYFIEYSSDQAWTFSYSLDNGSTWNALTIPSSSDVVAIRKSLPGLVVGKFIMAKCEQPLIDSNFKIHHFGFEYEPGYEYRDD